MKGQPILNNWKHFKGVPSNTVESDALSKDPKKRGMTFVGSITIALTCKLLG